MNVGSTLKRAPKWAWYTAGGLSLGAIGLKLFKNRGGETAADETPVVNEEYGGGEGTSLVGGNPTSVIVPPIIQQASSDPNAGAGVLQELYLTATADVVGGFGNAWAMMQQQQGQLLQSSSETIQAIAMAGPAPRSDEGTPVVSQIPLPYVPPTAIKPRPAPAPKRVDKCKGAYPNEHGGKCYKVAVVKTGKNKGRWHHYSDGKKVKVGK